MPASIKLIAVDLDGTLLNAERQVCLAGLQALKRAEAAGIHIVVATARNAESTGKVVGGASFHGPVITSTGAVILKELNGEIWASHKVPRNVAHEIAAHADANQWGLSILADGVTHYSWDRATELKFMQRERNTRVAVASGIEAVKNDVTQIIIRDAEVIPKMREHCQTEFAAHVRLQPFYHVDGSIEAMAILPKLANKGDALGYVADKLGIPHAAVLALGDNDSDIAMFEQAGVSACMGNGTDRARKAAQCVAPHHDEGGVAWAVNSLVFGEGSRHG